MIKKYSILQKLIIPGIFLSLIIPTAVFATVGVGVGTGKINIQKELAQGGIYRLPSVPVLNTGNEPSKYGVDIEYLQNQIQLRPSQKWFSFSPKTFFLKPQHVQSVNITLTIPIKTRPGNYFAYIEAYPIKTAVSGVTRINIAAATKLYFTVAPSNIFQGIYYRVLTFVTTNAPWTYVVFALIGIAVLVAIFRRFFSFNLGISVRGKK